MPPFWDKLKAMYTGEESQDLAVSHVLTMIPEKVEPPISVNLAGALLVIYTFIYVVPFYLSSTTRPSAQLSRDAPAVIRARIQSVTWSCALCSIITFVLLSYVENGNPILSVHSMGYFPVGFVETAKCLGLTGILFLGPLFEAGIAEGAWRDWIRLRGIWSVLGSTIGYRNLVAGPVTEEILFRSCSVPLFVLANASLSTIVFGTPVIFGLAHVHHFYEFRLTNPHTPLSFALVRSLFQFAYTTLFGAYATFLYLRTGSLLAVILAHTFCNWRGLPRVWGRLECGETALMDPDVGEQTPGVKRDEDYFNISGGGEVQQLNILWSITYYIILVVGALGWWKVLWPLTESTSALIKF